MPRFAPAACTGNRHASPPLQSETLSRLFCWYLILWVWRAGKAGRAVQLWPYLKWNYLLIATPSHLMSYWTTSTGDKGEQGAAVQLLPMLCTPIRAAAWNRTASSPARSAPLLSIMVLPTKHSKMWFPLDPEAKAWTKIELHNWEHTHGHIVPDQQSVSCGPQKPLMDEYKKQSKCRSVAHMVYQPRFWQAVVLGLHMADMTPV